MLDAVIDYMPSPTEVPAIKGHLDDKDETVAERHSSDEEPFAALAFKIATDPFVGSLTFFRVYSGVLNSGDTIRCDLVITATGVKPNMDFLAEKVLDTDHGILVKTASYATIIARRALRFR